MKVGVVSASSSRLAGGMYTSVRELALNLRNEHGLDQKVFSLKDSFSEIDLDSWDGLSVSNHEIVSFKAFGYAPRFAFDIAKFGPDLLHSHGMWMYPSAVVGTNLLIHQVPYVLSPHGMLDAWALNKSRWKKAIALDLFERSHLRNASCIHALNEDEYKAIRRFGLTGPVAVIPNGINLPGNFDSGPTLIREERKILGFLGRLDSKKGLSELISAWGLLVNGAPSLADEWVLHIAGWGDSSYEDSLKRQVKLLGCENSVVFLGPLYGLEKSDFLRRISAFILPSYSEGLPMAVLEAWSFQIPVLMTPECNLSGSFGSGAAICISNEPVRLKESLVKFFELPSDDLKVIAQRGRRLVEASYSWSLVGKSMHHLYRWILGAGPIPESVILE